MSIKRQALNLGSSGLSCGPSSSQRRKYLDIISYGWMNFLKLRKHQFIMDEDKPFNYAKFVELLKSVALQLSIKQPDINNQFLAAICTMIAMRLTDKSFKIDEVDLTKEYVSYLKFIRFIDNSFSDAEVVTQVLEINYVHPLGYYQKDLEEEDGEANTAKSGQQ
ncbi:hypothetical protein MIR68_003991 [Amoeboaphelidium protococcarum]|nr:hypothetical protein MIR68_003991 [Amoeboaphelidium protococcarum]